MLWPGGTHAQSRAAALGRTGASPADQAGQKVLRPKGMFGMATALVVR